MTYLVDVLDSSGVIEDSLGQGGFPAVNVRRNPNVP